MDTRTIAEQKRALKHEDIAVLAWQFWQQEGCQAGRDKEYWLKAEQLLLIAAQEGVGWSAMNHETQSGGQPVRAKPPVRPTNTETTLSASGCQSRAA